jgi:hypothetical protein
MPSSLRRESIVSRAIRIAAAPHAAFRRLGGHGGGVLLHLESTAYFQLNELGATIWQVLENEITFDELVIRVGTLFEDSPANLAEDIAHFIDELAARNLIVIEPLS